MNRRSLLRGLFALSALPLAKFAPAAPIVFPKPTGSIGTVLLTPEIIAREAAKILNQHMKRMGAKQ